MTEAAELIARLRAIDPSELWKSDAQTIEEAADHIETLEARVATLSAALEQAMRLHTRLNVAQYLFSNTRARSNGAQKAHHHDELTKAYVAVIRGVDIDRVRRRCEDDYAAVHDTTAAELTNRLDEAIGFDMDAFVGDDVIDRFFSAFHAIAIRTLAAREASR